HRTSWTPRPAHPPRLGIVPRDPGISARPGSLFLSRRQVNPESPKGSAGSSHVEERTTGGTPWQGESEEKRSKLELELDGSQRRSLPPCGIHGPGDPFERESTGRPQGRARRAEERRVGKDRRVRGSTGEERTRQC